jgi:hypothetical protein
MGTFRYVRLENNSTTALITDRPPSLLEAEDGGMGGRQGPAGNAIPRVAGKMCYCQRRKAIESGILYVTLLFTGSCCYTAVNATSYSSL